MGILYQVVIKCRKCESEQRITIPDTFSAGETLKKLSKIEKTDCPVCGEEPEDNWYFAGVRKVVSKT